MNPLEMRSMASPFFGDGSIPLETVYFFGMNIHFGSFWVSPVHVSVSTARVLGQACNHGEHTGSRAQQTGMGR